MVVKWSILQSIILDSWLLFLRHTLLNNNLKNI